MSAHIHILGICGTFMGGVALLAREMGWRVTGSDANVYPPMSTQLREAGIEVMEGYGASQLDAFDQPPNYVVIGNALSRGNELVERILDSNIAYTSGPQWLAENILRNKWVLAVSGTHGKTTTSSLLAWLLEDAGMAPGFLIGGVPANFGVSARLGNSDFFVVEADEYDTAFFDKRSKFVHYRPRTLVINNLEFDHADIFEDLQAIQRQFHHLLRCVPAQGRVIHPADSQAVAQTLEMGLWTQAESFAVGGQGSADFSASLQAPDGSVFNLSGPALSDVEVQWSHCGLHNVENALAAMIAARHVGVTPEHSAAALSRFKGVKRRLELLGEVAGVAVYDDFAHHPTAIATTLQGLRARSATGRVLALIEPRSNTMRLGVHRSQLAASTEQADKVYWFQPEGLDWSLEEVVTASAVPAQLHSSIDALVDEVVAEVQPADQVVVMSNGSFGGIHEKLLAGLKAD